MGQATRTTKLLLDLGNRRQGGANTGKRAALDATIGVLNGARAFYIDFLLAYADKLSERIPYYSEQHLEMRERAISANELLTWAEACTVETREHQKAWKGWNFTQRFPDMPLGRCARICPILRTGKRAARRRANRAYLEPKITPPSTKAPAPWSWKAATCTPGLC